MPIHSSDPVFIEEFVRTCFDQGLTEDEAAEFFKAAHTQDLLDNDSDYREGFLEAMQKFAVENPGAWDVMSPGSQASAWGGLGGAVAGGAAALMRARKNPMGAIGALGHIAGGALGGGVLGRLAHGASARADDFMNGPKATGPYIPDWARNLGSKATTATPTGKTNFPVSALGGYPTDYPSTSTSPASSPGLPAPMQALNDKKTQLNDLNTKIQALRTSQNSTAAAGGRGSELGFRDIGRQVQELENQKGTLLGSVGSDVGHMRAQQGDSTRAIDDQLTRTNHMLNGSGSQLDTAEAWMRNHRGGQWWQPSHWWEQLNGVEGRAEQANSQVSNLEGLRKQLMDSRQAVNGPWQ